MDHYGNSTLRGHEMDTHFHTKFQHLFQLRKQSEVTGSIVETNSN